MPTTALNMLNTCPRRLSGIFSNRGLIGCFLYLQKQRMWCRPTSALFRPARVCSAVRTPPRCFNQITWLINAAIQRSEPFVSEPPTTGTRCLCSAGRHGWLMRAGQVLFPRRLRGERSLNQIGNVWCVQTARSGFRRV